MLTLSDELQELWPLIVAEEEEDEGDDGYEGDAPFLPLPQPPPATSPYWSTDDGAEEEE